MIGCDARLCTDSAGNLGRFDAIASGPAGHETYSADIGVCSDDRVTIWHGMDSPAIACGKHARYRLVQVFRGHHNREDAR